MAVYVTTSDGTRHRYAGSHTADNLILAIEAGDTVPGNWLYVEDSQGRRGRVRTSAVVAIAETVSNDSITGPDEVYTPD